MRSNAGKLKRGAMLIEVMIASLAVAVIMVGVMQFQYYCAMHAHKADVRATAGRLGLLLLEAWKTAGGDPLYNPVLVFGSDGLNILDIESSGIGPGGLGTEILAGPSRITFENTEYCVTLSYVNAVIGPAGNPQMLNVSVARLNSDGDLERPVSLTTYADY